MGVIIAGKSILTKGIKYEDVIPYYNIFDLLSKQIKNFIVPDGTRID